MCDIPVETHVDFQRDIVLCKIACGILKSRVGAISFHVELEKVFSVQNHLQAAGSVVAEYPRARMHLRTHLNYETASLNGRLGGNACHQAVSACAISKHLFFSSRGQLFE